MIQDFFWMQLQDLKINFFYGQNEGKWQTHLNYYFLSCITV